MKETNLLSVVKPSTTKELTEVYACSAKTFRKWLEPHRAAIGARQGRYWTVAQVKMILEKLGVPCKVNHNGMDV